jgi:hypothetical protein
LGVLAELLGVLAELLPRVNNMTLFEVEFSDFSNDNVMILPLSDNNASTEVAGIF